MTNWENWWYRLSGRSTDGNWMGWPGRVLLGFGLGLILPNLHGIAFADETVTATDLFKISLALAAFIGGEILTFRMVDDYIRRLDILSVAWAGLTSWVVTIAGVFHSLAYQHGETGIVTALYAGLIVWAVLRLGIFMVLWSRDQD